MSIIEKAVENLERKTSTQERPGSAGARTTATVEKVVTGGDDGAARGVEDLQGRDLQAGLLSQQDIADPEALRPKTSFAKPKVSIARSALPSPDQRLELPLESLAEKGMLTPLSPRSHIAEEFRTIKRPLLRNIGGNMAVQIDNANLIMVTSALQGDGKTFTAVNLAISIALEQDKTVLFVDADVAKASAGTMLGVPSQCPGLIDVLENKGISLADAILPTSIENLRVLPAGNVHERSTELLASQSMQELMLEMSNRYSDRVIVFDSPPMMLTTEASVLASFMGQIAFVVSTDETPQEAVTKALERIGEDKIIGMVLNKAHSRRSRMFGLGYGYGYGYGYGGQGYGHGERPAPSGGG